MCIYIELICGVLSEKKAEETVLIKLRRKIDFPKGMLGAGYKGKEMKQKCIEIFINEKNTGRIEP